MIDEELQAPFRKVTGPQSYSLNGLKRTEFQHEYDPKGGEIASQVKGHEMAKDAKLKGKSHVELPGGVKASVKDMMMPGHVYRAMKTLSRSPGLVRQKMTGANAGRENYSKEKIRQRGVLNTSGGQSWNDAKKDITPERVKRAEVNRSKTQTSPTILRVKDPTDRSGKKNTEWTIGGNTRLSSMPDKGGKTSTQVIKMKEEIVNSAGGPAGQGSQIAGIGIANPSKSSNFGEPGVSPRHQPKKNKSVANSIVASMMRRRSPVMEQQIDETDAGSAKEYGRKALASYKKARDKHVDAVAGLKSSIPPEYVTGTAQLKTMEKRVKGMTRAANIIQKDKSDIKRIQEETFAGAMVFEVSSKLFYNITLQKRKGKHWRTYLEEDDCYAEIREWARKHPKGKMAVKNENTGEIRFIRY